VVLKSAVEPPGSPASGAILGLACVNGVERGVCSGRTLAFAGLM
jgi:hypothetical protein